MKKNRKMLGLAAAALLAVAPVATSVVTPVSAAPATTKTTSTAQVISIVDKDGKALTKDANSNSYSDSINLSSNENS